MYDVLSFIKNDGSSLVNLIKLVVITFSIWMIWRMRNYARFQVNIDLSRVISTIKDFTCLVGNSSKSNMMNDMYDFNVLQFVGINARTGKVIHLLSVKINIDGAAWGSPVLTTCGGIFCGSMREFISGFSTFLDI